MKILVYGAGVLGSLLAGRLQQAGHDVSLLARGQRLADLREHGLVLRNMVTGEQSVAPANVVEQLAPHDTYKLVLVVMSHDQALATLPALAANHGTPNVLFMGNNLRGADEYVAALGHERVLLGFPVAGGTRKGHVVHYAAGMGNAKARIVFGELGGAVTPRMRQIAVAFESAGFSSEISRDVDAWLRCHAAAIVALAGAYYGSGMDAQRLARTADALVLAVRAIKEGFGVLRANGVPVTPRRNAVVYEGLPEPLIVGLFSRLVRQPVFQYAFSHAESARPEMQSLARELTEMARASTLATPNLDRLCQAIDLHTPLMPEGSAQIIPDWRLAWAWVIALKALVVGTWLVWLVLRRRSRDERRTRPART